MENLKMHSLKRVNDEQMLYMLKKSPYSTEGYFEILDQVNDDGFEFVEGFRESFKNEIEIFYIKIFDTLICIEETGIKSINIPSKIINEYILSKKVNKACWSGTHMMLAVLYTDGTVETMTLDKFGEPRIIGKSHISSEVPNRKNVGWGSEMKQFQGLKIQEDENESVKVSFETDRSNFIAWNQKHERFLVSFYGDSGRKFKVFGNRCSPLYSSDFVPGELLGPVSWKPQGNQIACSFLKDGRNSIALFEPNSMYLKSFYLTHVLHRVTEIKWSICGKILSLVQNDNDTNYVTLYTMKNNQWFLKQTLIFKNYMSIHWIYASENCPVLLVNTKDEFIQYTFKFEIDYNFSDYSKIACINGNKVYHVDWSNTSLIDSDFGKIVIKNEFPINAIKFNKENQCAIIDCHNNLKIYNNWNLISIFESESFIHHLTYLNELYFIRENINTEIIRLKNHPEIINNRSILEDPVEHLIPTSHDLIIQTNKLRINQKESREIKPAIFMTPHKTIFFELNDKNELSIDGQIITYPVSSFLVTDDYLFFTKEQDVYSVALNEDNIERLINEVDKISYVRPLNQIGTIVGLLREKLVVQIYRGDFEFVSCKLMEISYVESLICENKWDEVVDYVRVNRLNWNLLIDLDYYRFYNNIETILPHFNSNVLTSLIGEITNDNVLTTIYSSCNYKPIKVSNKKENILAKILEFIEKRGVCNFIPITIKISMEHYGIFKALQYVCDLLDYNEHGVTCYCTEEDIEIKSKEAVNVIRKYNVDNLKIYKEAMLLLDPDVVKVIATHCQLDPLVFEPYLHRLSNLPEVERRFAIFHDLKKHGEAFPYLIRFERKRQVVLNYINRNNIHKEAFDECILSKPKYSIDVAKLYAEKLSKDKKYNEALLILTRFKLYDLAVEESIKALNHEMFLKTLNFINLEDNEKKNYIERMAKTLQINGKLKESAMLYKNYLNDVKKAVEVLLEKRYFKEAFLCIPSGNILEMLLRELMKELDVTKTFLEESSTTFDNYLERLLELRAERENVRNVYGKDYDDSQSIYSDTSSVRSSSSKNSSSSVVTSASRRKQLKLERKKRDLCRGSKLEDVALVIALHELTVKIFDFGESLNDLFFVSIGSDVPFDVLKNLQRQLSDLQEKVDRAVSKIWIDPVCYHIEYLDEIYRVAPQFKGYSWMLDILK